MLKTSRKYIFLLVVALIIIDVVLVTDWTKYPTFSEVVEQERTLLMGFTFLFGGLFAKIYYNQKTSIKGKDKRGVIIFSTLVLLLSFLGFFAKQNGFTVATWQQLVLLISGGVVAYLVWPQFKEPDITSPLMPTAKTGTSSGRDTRP
ncbi:MAG: hypothetical protein AAF840_02945 [Bacteroidota bacterium]